MFIWVILGLNTYAEELKEADYSVASGYYCSDDEAVLIMQNGRAYDVTPGHAMEQVDYKVYGEKDHFVFINMESPDEVVYFEQQREKGMTETGGIYYSVYVSYEGTTDEVEYIEGRQIQYGNYIFDNDYDVYVREPLSVFFSIETEDMDENSKNIPLLLEDKGFNTPLECLQYFTKGLAEGNLDSVLQAFAVNHYIERGDFTAQLEGAAWSLHLSYVLPANDELSMRLDKENFRSVIITTIIKMCIQFSSDIDYTMSHNINNAEAEAFVEDISLVDLGTLAVRRIDYVNPERQDSESQQKYNAKRCVIWGCEDIQDYYVLYELQGQMYAGSVTVVQYDGLWYIFSLNSSITEFPGGGIEALSENEYLEMVTE